MTGTDEEWLAAIVFHFTPADLLMAATIDTLDGEEFAGRRLTAEERARFLALDPKLMHEALEWTVHNFGTTCITAPTANAAAA